MTKPAAMPADYVDLKFVKGRKVAQIVLEIPIEKAGEFVAAFGTPLPAESVPVALARLGGKVEETADDRPRRRMSELPLPNQAALLCDREAFWRYLNERERVEVGPDGSSLYWGDVRSPQEAATRLRAICEVTSRAEIKPGTEAGKRFLLLQAEFDTWFRVPA